MGPERPADERQEAPPIQETNPADFPDINQGAAPPPQSSLTELLNLVMAEGPREDYARQVVQAELDRALFSQDIKLASIFAQCGAFDDLKKLTAKQAIALAMAKIQIGRSWGIAPPDAMRYVFFTNGKPCVETAIIAAKMREAGFDWDIEWHDDPSGKCIGCTLWPKKWNKDQTECLPITDREGKPVSVSFTKRDADGAIIWENRQQKPLSEKWNYKAWPRDMYFARCISRYHKFYASNVMRGASSKQEVEDVAASQEPDELAMGILQGSREDQERLAEKKILDMKAEQERRSKGTAPGETPEERNARIQRQINEQTEATKKPAETKQPESETKPPAAETPRPKYTRDTLPDAESVKVGSECEYEGKVLRVVEEDGEAAAWKTVEELPKQTQSQQPKRTERQAPAFGRRNG